MACSSTAAGAKHADASGCGAAQENQDCGLYGVPVACHACFLACMTSRAGILDRSLPPSQGEETGLPDSLLFAVFDGHGGGGDLCS